MGEEEGRGKEGELFDISYLPSYTFIYLNIPSNTSKYLYIPPYTCLYLKILNIRNMRTNIKHTNGHNSGPRAPRRVRI